MCSEGTLGGVADTLGIARNILRPLVRTAEGSESDANVPEAEPSQVQTHGSLNGRRSPFFVTDRRLPEWPPRFEDGASYDPSRGTNGGMGNTSLVGLPSWSPKVTSEQQLYPATSRPNLSLGDGPLVTVLDPMEIIPVPLTSRVGDGDVHTRATQFPSPAPTLSASSSTSEVGQQTPSYPREPAEVDLTSRREVVISDGQVPSRWPDSPGMRAAMAKIDKTPVITTEVCEQAAVLARVGGDVILAGEILGAVNEMLLPYRDKVPASVFEQYKQQLMRRLLLQRVEMKLVYQDAKRHLPPEAIEHFEKEVGKLFDEKELPDRLKKMGLNSPQEFDTRLKSVGSSLAHEKQAFMEAIIAREWLRQQTQAEKDPLTAASPEELAAYYRAHIQEFEEPGWVEWRQLTVRKRPDRSDADAYARVAEMRERVLRGEPFEAVARSMSEGPTAASGGLRERTYRGSLRSKTLEDVLFSLPEGTISPIVEDDQGYHVVQVIRRQDTRRVPFSEAQVQIREKLAQERRQQVTQEWLNKLSKEIPVWTIYDQSEQPSQSSLR